MPRPLIVAMGGFPGDPLLDTLLSLVRGRRLLYVGTAAMESAEHAVQVYELLRGRAEVSRLRFYPWVARRPARPRARPRRHPRRRRQHCQHARRLARSRLRQRPARAWESGVVLAGWSAGAICWFEAAVTDSFGPRLAGMRDGPGFLPGSACPHYDGEELRRPVYRRLVAEEGFPAGIAIDDAAAAVFAGSELDEVLATGEGSTAYRVSASGEERLGARLLG